MSGSIKFFLVTIFLIFVTAVAFNCKSKADNSSTPNNSTSQDSVNNQNNNQNGQGMMNGRMMGGGMMGGGMNSNNSKNTNSNNGWIAPPSSKTLINPIKDIVEDSKLGGKLFNQNCAACHGKDAKGDGPTGVLLNPKPANLISNKVQVQTDGEIFWKISNGNPPMPGFKNSFSKKQRWELVDYIRSLIKN